MRKYSLFGMYIYHRILVTLSFNKFYPTDTTYLKIASPSSPFLSEYHILGRGGLNSHLFPFALETNGNKNVFNKHF